MNKIMKAISELRGDYSFDEDNLVVCIKANSVFKLGHIERYSCDAYSDLNTKYWSALCSRKEFNETLEQLEASFGASCSYDDYIAEFWSGAPKGYNYFSKENTEHYDCFLRVKGDTLMVMRKETGFTECFDVSELGKYDYVERPIPKQTKPVYTQAMKDNGDMVEAGMLFATKTGEYAAEYTNKKSIVFTDEEGFLISLNRGYAKPIDQRTPKEKAIDDLRNADESVCNNINWHENFLQLIIDGKICGVKWVGE